MNFRLAKKDDLPQLHAVFQKIIQHMNQNNVPIWDEYYPCCCFEGDIQEGRLFLLEEHGEIASVCALCASNEGETAVKWKNQSAKALYMERLGVNTDYMGKGMGSLMLQKAAALAGEKGAESLRLFVVENNQPAINLYKKNGFEQANGIFHLRIDDDLTLHEYGFERKTSR